MCWVFLLYFGLRKPRVPSFPLKDYIVEAIITQLWRLPGDRERYKWESRSETIPVPLNPAVEAAPLKGFAS